MRICTYIVCSWPLLLDVDWEENLGSGRRIFDLCEGVGAGSALTKKTVCTSVPVDSLNVEPCTFWVRNHWTRNRCRVDIKSMLVSPPKTCVDNNDGRLGWLAAGLVTQERGLSGGQVELSWWFERQSLPCGDTMYAAVAIRWHDDQWPASLWPGWTMSWNVVLI